MMPITSPNNPKLRAALRLESARGRKQQGRLLVHGHQELMRGLRGKLSFVELFLCPKLLTSEQLANLQQVAEQHSIAVYTLPPELFRHLAYGERIDGAVGVALRPETELNQLSLPEGPLFVVVVEGVEKPGNLGAIARSIDGAGAAALLAADPQTDFFHPNAIRASLGTILNLPLAAGTSEAILAWLRQHQFSVFAALVGAEKTLWEVQFPERVALVFGNEAKGLTSLWQGAPVRGISLPMLGTADSLNVSNTAAIFAYELSRQRSNQRT